jgi:hypothetical protein
MNERLREKEEITMPGGDRTGPVGMGPRTGRVAGYCGGFGMPGYANRGMGRGFGMGFGRGGAGWGRGRGFGGGGRGWRHRFYATGQPGRMRFGADAPAWTPDTANEKELLKSEADALRSELELIEKRLSEIEAETGSE